MTWATDRLKELESGNATLPPIVQTLKLGGLDEWGEGWVRKIWHPAPEVQTVDGSIFGGYLAALADQVLAFAAMTVVPDEMLLRTINLHLDFVRVARMHPIQIEGRVFAQTKQMITVGAEFLQGDKLIAKAGAQQLLMSFDRWPDEEKAKRMQDARLGKKP